MISIQQQQLHKWNYLFLQKSNFKISYAEFKVKCKKGHKKI